MSIYVRAIDGMSNHTAGDLRAATSDLINAEGVLDLAGGHFLVTEKGTPDMSVDVAAGIAYVLNDAWTEFSSDQRLWDVLMDASVNKAIDSNPSGSTRYDLICLKIDDGVTPDANASNVATVVVVKGTPGAGVPALPDDHLLLATITIANGETAINTADIADGRSQISLNTDISPTSSWTPFTATLVYSSTDDPTGIVTIAGDWTSILSIGMKIKFTNGGNTIYGKITATPTYGAPNTTVKFCHEIDPTDSLALYLMANSPITNAYYSSHAVPFGFPVDMRKWMVEVIDTSNAVQSTPTANVWSNTNLPEISVPIGSWKIEWHAALDCQEPTSPIARIKGTLSTANNSESNSKLTCDHYSGALRHISTNLAFDFITLTAKTPYYLNIATPDTGVDAIAVRGDLIPTRLLAALQY